jgi:hypothetical protein
VTQVVREGSVLKLWYQPDSSTMGGQYATSTDGLAWVISSAAVATPRPLCVLWNEVASRYEGLIYLGIGYAPIVRP